METISWEILVAAGAVLFGQGGILYSGRRYLINGLGKDVTEIKHDVKTLIEGQHNHDTRISLNTQDIAHIKEEF